LPISSASRDTWLSPRNLPLEELAERLDELGEDPERPIAIICRTDRRSAKAAALLGPNGVSPTCSVVRGGMTAWLERVGQLSAVLFNRSEPF